jgi:hypothetical protein
VRCASCDNGARYSNHDRQRRSILATYFQGVQPCRACQRLSFHCAIVFTMNCSTGPANALASQHLNPTDFELFIRCLLALAAVQIASVCQRGRAITLAFSIDRVALCARNAFCPIAPKTSIENVADWLRDTSSDITTSEGD